MDVRAEQEKRNNINKFELDLNLILCLIASLINKTKVGNDKLFIAFQKHPGSLMKVTKTFTKKISRKMKEKLLQKIWY